MLVIKIIERILAGVGKAFPCLQNKTEKSRKQRISNNFLETIQLKELCKITLTISIALRKKSWRTKKNFIFSQKNQRFCRFYAILQFPIYYFITIHHI